MKGIDSQDFTFDKLEKIHEMYRKGMEKTAEKIRYSECTSITTESSKFVLESVSLGRSRESAANSNVL